MYRHCRPLLVYQVSFFLLRISVTYESFTLFCSSAAADGGIQIQVDTVGTHQDNKSETDAQDCMDGQKCENESSQTDDVFTVGRVCDMHSLLCCAKSEVVF
jgi:hypothetical protein